MGGFWSRVIGIGSKSDAKWFKTVFGQKPWTPPFGFWSKWFRTKVVLWLAKNDGLYRKKEPRNDVWGGLKSDWKQILVF